MGTCVHVVHPYVFNIYNKCEMQLRNGRGFYIQSPSEEADGVFSLSNVQSLTTRLPNMAFFIKMQAITQLPSPIFVSLLLFTHLKNVISYISQIAGVFSLIRPLTDMN